MRTVSHLIIIAALGASTSAMAAPGHLTDVQYMQAARCRALIASPALGGGDTTQIDSLLKREGSSRIDFVYQKASEIQRDTARQARDAGPEKKASLMAERNGVCEAFGGSVTASTTAPMTSN